MYKKFVKDLGYYLSLIAILGVGLASLFLTGPNLRLQILIIGITAFFYVLWGALHHFINHELTLKIMLEYVLIAALGLAVLFFMIVGGMI